MNDFQLGQKMYGVTSGGNIKVWSCFAEDNGDGVMLVVLSQTKMGGKESRRATPVKKGKNLGKSNETTPFEQAELEAASKYRKQLDKGYTTEIPTDTSAAGCNTLGFPKPMLAHPLDKVKQESLTFPAFVQPKLDGHRAIVTKKDGVMVMYSRQGKLITTMAHILAYLEDKVEEGVFLDGELYLHGEALQNIGSYIKKQRPESLDVTYNVYDIMMDSPYAKRSDVLMDILPDDESAVVKMVDTRVVTSLAQAQSETLAFVAEGYEGGMLRIPDEGYRAGFKSRTLLKLKSFDDSEHEIVGVKEGKDRVLEDDTVLKVAIFECITPEGKEFECTAFGTMYDKDRIYHERADYIGKQLTVKHMGHTEDGKPWHPVALRLREDI